MSQALQVSSHGRFLEIDFLIRTTKTTVPSINRCSFVEELEKPGTQRSFFDNSHLIRRIQQNKIYKKFRDLTRD